MTTNKLVNNSTHRDFHFSTWLTCILYKSFFFFSFCEELIVGYERDEYFTLESATTLEICMTIFSGATQRQVVIDPNFIAGTATGKGSVQGFSYEVCWERGVG